MQENLRKLPKSVRCPTRALYSLTPVQLKIYLLLKIEAAKDREEEWISASLVKMHRLLKCASQRSVQTALARLEDEGFIEKRTGSGRAASQFKIK